MDNGHFMCEWKLVLVYDKGIVYSYAVLTIYYVLSSIPIRRLPLSYFYGTFLSLTVLCIMYFPQMEKEAFCLTTNFMFHGRKKEKITGLE